jgi:DNA replication protein DnaC
MAKRLMKLLTNPEILAIGGPRGTGKSTLAWAAVMKFCDCGRPALYRTAGELFHELSDAAWEKKQDVRDGWFKPDLLVIDEVQVRDGDRQWQDNELTTLVDRRYREDKATLILSNLTAAALKQNLGESIWRRLIETGGQPFELNVSVHEHLKHIREGKK